GRADLLAELFARIDDQRADFPVKHAIHVFLGDYVDRGPSSREVIDLLIERGHRYPVVYLKGNHESYVADFLQNPAVLNEWRAYGALNTLPSYGLPPSAVPDDRECSALASAFGRALPDHHRQFLHALKLSFTCGDFFFVHAGVRPGIPLARQQKEDLLWI